MPLQAPPPGLPFAGGDEYRRRPVRTRPPLPQYDNSLPYNWLHDEPEISVLRDVLEALLLVVVLCLIWWGIQNRRARRRIAAARAARHLE